MRGNDPFTGKFFQTSKENWENHFKRNFEKLIQIITEKSNGSFRCLVCDCKFDTKPQLLTHFRFNKDHVFEFFLSRIEDPVKDQGDSNC